MSQTSRGGDTAPPSTATALPTPKERRRLREALSLSEEQVAEAMGVTKATVKAWETGRSAPRGRKREAYAKLLGGAPDTAPDSAADATPDAVSEETPGTRTGKPAPAPAPANVRPKAAVKRAAKPPKAPSRPEQRRKPEPESVGEPAPAPVPGLTPEEAFDALYGYAAPGLVHQAYLLTGRRHLSREAVEHAFRHAWEHWPEVATDADPVGWVRAAAYEYALSPWHRLRRAHRHPDAPPTEAGRRALLGALLDLPAPYRRTVLLYDGLGLDLPETAAETEASTPAAANRLLYAHAELGRRVPELAEPEALQRRLATLVAEAPTATLPGARAVRGGSERRTRRMTRAVVGATAVLACVTALTAATAPTRYIPEIAPGQTVNGVPVRGGPQKLGEEDIELRDRLRSEPNPGPERLVPRAE
ncbi:helix-turn-helix domain-containing protein [Streptomyces sp. R302]|uniref:helix-turn-helix domain-containing protein n=1 Tax=unclassified Streptomyces TaxID=2593676 RepID=UPI00145D6713|nr:MULTISPECIES: helix-turn-helix domain-containing protein [unclassified Streptomyces]NML50472.1 helix-turn-helix domain-containing protein [Streptomyces sp. R301]NML79463.1 helix-turn-helix domain-containing protein [Streptomyces sp. R302]